MIKWAEEASLLYSSGHIRAEGFVDVVAGVVELAVACSGKATSSLVALLEHATANDWTNATGRRAGQLRDCVLELDR